MSSNDLPSMVMARAADDMSAWPFVPGSQEEMCHLLMYWELGHCTRKVAGRGTRCRNLSKSAAAYGYGDGHEAVEGKRVQS